MHYLIRFVYISALFLNLLSAFAQHARSTEAVIQNKGSAEGYVLFAPLGSKSTYLIDKCGTLLHSWKSAYGPAQSVYLLSDGSLLRPGDDTTTQDITAVGGIIERFDWDNNVLWSYHISNMLERQHHDIYPLPNGNILAIVYRKRTREEALAAGRKPSEAEPFLLDEKVIEIKPIGRDSGLVVWQWDVWDHLVQDVDPKLPHYGIIAQNPRLLNINFAPSSGTDWLHFNAISYNASLDHIIISSHELSEIYIIDHSTTTAQAASHNGGKQGKGGDLLYRWGNPIAYNAGTATDQKLFKQHNPHWIDKGLTGQGKIMVFNNGPGRANPSYSTVDMIDPPKDRKGRYILEPGKMAGPAEPIWSYRAGEPACFFSDNISGAQRLSNGNTLICSGHIGKFFEIDPNKNIVWVYNTRKGVQTLIPGHPKSGQTFRCTFYESSYPAFKGKALSPCAPSEINPAVAPCISK